MHDLLEGINVVHKVIYNAIRENNVTLEALNTNLHVASKDVCDSPNAFNSKNVRSSGTITGSASQKWLLFLLLPKIVGKFLYFNNAVWQVYLLLRSITDIIFAPVVKKSSLSYLEGLIIEFLSQFTALFGTDPLHGALSLVNWQVWAFTFSVVHADRRQTTAIQICNRLFR